MHCVFSYVCLLMVPCDLLSQVYDETRYSCANDYFIPMSLFLRSKCQKYSPSEPTKLYDKTMTRRGEMTFNSHFKDLMFKQSDLEKDEMVNYYIEVCMISLTP